MQNSCNLNLRNCYNFISQDVFTLPASADKIVSGPDKLLVSSLTKNVLTVHDLADRGVVTHALNTQGVIQQIDYCQVTNHIATIENNVLHVYQSWWSELRRNIIGTAKCFSWCRTSGRLAVFDGSRIVVFEDLSPLFEVYGVADVSEIQLCETILAVTTSTFALVLTLHDEGYETSCDDEIVWNFDRPELIINAQSLVSVPRREKIYWQSKIPDSVDEVYLPTVPIHGLNVEVRNLSSHTTYQAKVILFKRSPPVFMRLLPYVTRSTELNQDPLSSYKGELEYVTFFLADATGVELFSVLGPEYRYKLKLLEKAKSFALDECFMHVLTQSSLRSYSIPIPGVSKRSQSSILLSTHLMSMDSLLMSRDYVVVLSSCDMGEMTVYALLKPTTTEFFDDIICSDDESIRQCAEDVVRFQVRHHGEACSEKLRSLYRSIQRDSSSLRISSLFDTDLERDDLLNDALAEADLSLLLSEEGLLTDLGKRVVSRNPSVFPLLLKKCDCVCPQLLREQMAIAEPPVASAICDYVCDHLQRIDARKLHKKTLTKLIPPWVYELSPFNGHRLDEECTNENNCLCLRCCAGLLHAVLVLASAPRHIGHTKLLQRIPEHVPDVLRFACLIPLTKSSSADPDDFAHVAETIVRLAQRYTQKPHVDAPHLLTVLSDVLSLADFLHCVPQSSSTVLPWVENGLMRERARRLKQEIVNFGSELRPLLP